ncbi:hypothetical protein, partial [Pseudomonas syringae]|uniref:hypothetical protein n=1 Tax=Pseudomonas syringae TaxID=317 RepID=UPI0019D71091
VSGDVAGLMAQPALQLEPLPNADQPDVAAGREAHVPENGHWPQVVASHPEVKFCSMKQR